MSQNAESKKDNNDDFSAQHSSRLFVWNFNSFFTCFVRPRHVNDSGIELEGHKNHRLNLKDQQDLKCLVWAYGGPRPSLIKNVEVTVNKEEFTVKVHWNLYDSQTNRSSKDDG